MARPTDIDTEILDDSGPTFTEVLRPLRVHAPLLLLGPIVAAALGFGGSYVVKPSYLAATSFLPPQQQQSAAGSALAALGSLTALAGVGSAVRTPADQYAALMRSVTVSDRIIEQFDLMKVYDADYRSEARRDLNRSVRINVGKKDGLISVEVEDVSPARAAQIANQYVEELRRVTSALAITEAQQRRAFFEKLLQETRDRLMAAQLDLQRSGFNPGALKAEPKAAAESYARLKAETSAAEIRLQTLRSRLADGTTEVQQAVAALAALRSQLAKAEQPNALDAGPDYVGKYREFKYQEALFELYARQFELARLDESREGALIQVIDPAQPPDKKYKPSRLMWTGLGAAIGVVASVALAFALTARRTRRSMA